MSSNKASHAFTFVVGLVCGIVAARFLFPVKDSTQEVEKSAFVASLISIVEDENLKSEGSYKVDAAITMLGYCDNNPLVPPALFNVLGFAPSEYKLQSGGPLFPIGQPSSPPRFSALRSLNRLGPSVIQPALDYLCRKNLSESN